MGIIINFSNTQRYKRSLYNINRLTKDEKEYLEKLLIIIRNSPNEANALKTTIDAYYFVSTIPKIKDKTKK